MLIGRDLIKHWGHVVLAREPVKSERRTRYDLQPQHRNKDNDLAAAGVPGTNFDGRIENSLMESFQPQ
jgi:hypothetical protein